MSNGVHVPFASLLLRLDIQPFLSRPCPPAIAAIPFGHPSLDHVGHWTHPTHTHTQVGLRSLLLRDCCGSAADKAALLAARPSGLGVSWCPCADEEARLLHRSRRTAGIAATADDLDA